MNEEVLVDYDVVSDVAGHTKNRGVVVVEAAQDIFSRVKEKAMQVAVKGEFLEFDSVEELNSKLIEAAQNGFSIRVYDEVMGG